MWSPQSLFKFSRPVVEGLASLVRPQTLGEIALRPLPLYLRHLRIPGNGWGNRSNPYQLPNFLPNLSHTSEGPSGQPASNLPPKQWEWDGRRFNRFDPHGFLNQRQREILPPDEEEDEDHLDQEAIRLALLIAYLERIIELEPPEVIEHPAVFIPARIIELPDKENPEEVDSDWEISSISSEALNEWGSDDSDTDTDSVRSEESVEVIDLDAERGRANQNNFLRFIVFLVLLEQLRRINAFDNSDETVTPERSRNTTEQGVQTVDDRDDGQNHVSPPPSSTTYNIQNLLVNSLMNTGDQIVNNNNPTPFGPENSPTEEEEKKSVESHTEPQEIDLEKYKLEVAGWTRYADRSHESRLEYEKKLDALKAKARLCKNKAELGAVKKEINELITKEKNEKFLLEYEVPVPKIGLNNRT